VGRWTFVVRYHGNQKSRVECGGVADFLTAYQYPPFTPARPIKVAVILQCMFGAICVAALAADRSHQLCVCVDGWLLSDCGRLLVAVRRLSVAESALSRSLREPRKGQPRKVRYHSRTLRRTANCWQRSRCFDLPTHRPNTPPANQIMSCTTGLHLALADC
jgi:hypothetical protein